MTAILIATSGAGEGRETTRADQVLLQRLPSNFTERNHPGNGEGKELLPRRALGVISLNGG